MRTSLPALAAAALLVSGDGGRVAAQGDSAVLDARLGPCSAEFTVTDADAKPVYAALVHVRLRYGAMGLKRMDLELGTDVKGFARVQGLPAKARPLTWEITKADRKTTVEQRVEATCDGRFVVRV